MIICLADMLSKCICGRLFSWCMRCLGVEPVTSEYAASCSPSWANRNTSFYVQTPLRCNVKQIRKESDILIHCLNVERGAVSMHVQAYVIFEIKYIENGGAVFATHNRGATRFGLSSAGTFELVHFKLTHGFWNSISDPLCSLMLQPLESWWRNVHKSFITRL